MCNVSLGADSQEKKGGGVAKGEVQDVALQEVLDGWTLWIGAALWLHSSGESDIHYMQNSNYKPISCAGGQWCHGEAYRRQQRRTSTCCDSLRPV